MFTFQITIGQVLMSISLLLFAWKLGQRVWEHDIMWNWFCKHNGLDARRLKEIIMGGTRGE